jgi:hypothetical protein
MSDQANQTQPYTPNLPIAFKRSDIAAMGADEYRRNRSEILRSQRAGVIIDDLSTLEANIKKQADERQQAQD